MLGKPQQNGFIESCNGRFCDEYPNELTCCGTFIQRKVEPQGKLSPWL
ncbi:integrase core domain-containing protein [Gluconacetobacter johannae]